METTTIATTAIEKHHIFRWQLQKRKSLEKCIRRIENGKCMYTVKQAE